MDPYAAPTGIPGLDAILQGLRLGDNVVWQVDTLEDYVQFALPFARRAMADGRTTVYLRFADHPRVLEAQPGLETVEVDPSPGFDNFSREVHRIIEDRGKGVFYIFDNLSALVAEWATDELLANFFQFTCPYLFEMDTVTYFALTRGKHAHGAVARIRDTTQLLIDAFHAGGRFIIHPIKVWDRYTPTMFLPHALTDGEWTPIFHSGEAAAVSLKARPPRSEGRASIAPWDSVHDRLRPFRGVRFEDGQVDPDVAVLKQELSRMLMGSHPEFNVLADRYLDLEDLLEVRDRVIGSGRIGGKAVGMLLARKILHRETDSDGTDLSQYLEPHDSFFIGSDVFFTFLVNNNLFKLRLEVCREARPSPAAFAEVERRFLLGKFPPAILEQFRSLLEYYGQAPIIVRSSSLLEDSFGNSFAGKYRSEFCANQGSPEERLDEFLRAVKLVYASALNPDALAYRRKRGLGDNDEQMAILVQRVSGMPYGKYFFPSLAGVAFSRNLYAWCDRIDPRQGIIRMVFGLGTRAVDRTGGDYTRLIPVSQPSLRPEIGHKIAKYSQRMMDLLDLERNALLTLPTSDVLQRLDYPNLHLFASVLRHGGVEDPMTRFIDAPPTDLVLTFNNAIRQTDLVRVLGRMLAVLERSYGRPVDTEFTASVGPRNLVHVNLLQCRPLFVPGAVEGVKMPASLPPERVLFRASGLIFGGIVPRIRTIVFVDPDGYAGLAETSKKKEVGRLVGRINHLLKPSEGAVMMIGPGRWGSSNIDLGVNVSYCDIDHTSVLVELSRQEEGHAPAVSYGTHFFLDLVEDQVICAAVSIDDPESGYRREFFGKAPSILTDLIPEASAFGDVVRVIDVPAATGGRHASVIADPQERKAVCFLD